MKKENNKSTFDGTKFAELTWDEGWTRINTVIDSSSPFLILDKSLSVVAGNQSFYEKFKVSEDITENKSIFKIGTGEWNIPKLRSSLSEILNKGTFFNGFEVTHHFPVLGHRVMLLNARQIHINSNIWQNFILLVIEDITEMMNLAARLSQQTNKMAFKMKENKKVNTFL